MKRVYGMKEGLLVLEFEDESADSLKSLLLTCFIHPTYIKSQEVSTAPLHGGGFTVRVPYVRHHLLQGCKFLSFVFGLQPSFISDIHQTIKNHIPGCPRCVGGPGYPCVGAFLLAPPPPLALLCLSCRAYLEGYGQVYLRAWKAASGVYRQVIGKGG